MRFLSPQLGCTQVLDHGVGQREMNRVGLVALRRERRKACAVGRCCQKVFPFQTGAAALIRGTRQVGRECLSSPGRKIPVPFQA